MRPWATSFIKLSILHFYAVTFQPHRKTVFTSYVLAALTVGYGLGTFFMAFALCHPFRSGWHVTAQGHCGDGYFPAAIVNLLIDVMIIALPLPCLWGLQMPVSRKISLTAIFSLGAV